MRIGLISDTHIPGGALEVPELVKKAFESVDLIIHGGNVYIPSVIDWLESIAPIKVAGSVDRDRGCHGDSRVAEKLVMELEGHTVAAVHDLMVPGFGGFVYPDVLKTHFNWDRYRPIVPDHVFGESVDIVIFGHTCTALVEEYDRQMLINPGSPTLRNQQKRIGTVAILELTPGSRDVQIVDLEKMS